MPMLYVMCGLPRSGKSTVVKEMVENNNELRIVSRDIIREHVLGAKGCMDFENVVSDICNTALNSLMRVGQDIIVDNTHLSYKYRESLYKLAKQFNYEVTLIRVLTDIPVILERCIKTDFPVEVIKKMLNTIDIYTAEWVDKVNYGVTIVDHIEHKTSDDRRELILSADGFDQNNPNHDFDLLTHMIKTADSVEEQFKIPVNGGYGVVVTDELKITDSSALWHDVGKLYTQSYDEKKGHSRYFGHNRASAYLNYIYWYSKPFHRDSTTFLIDNHMCRYNLNKHVLSESIDKFQNYIDRYGKSVDIRECLKKLVIADISSHKAELTGNYADEINAVELFFN